MLVYAGQSFVFQSMALLAYPSNGSVFLLALDLVNSIHFQFASLSLKVMIYNIHIW
jgi:hypothetical protein